MYDENEEEEEEEGVGRDGNAGFAESGRRGTMDEGGLSREACAMVPRHCSTGIAC